MTIMMGAWQQAGRHGVRAVAESFHAGPQAGGRKCILGVAGIFETSKPTLSDTHLLQQGHTSPNSQIVPPTEDQGVKYVKL